MPSFLIILHNFSTTPIQNKSHQWNSILAKQMNEWTQTAVKKQNWCVAMWIPAMHAKINCTMLLSKLLKKKSNSNVGRSMQCVHDSQCCYAMRRWTFVACQIYYTLIYRTLESALPKSGECWRVWVRVSVSVCTHLCVCVCIRCVTRCRAKETNRYDRVATARCTWCVRACVCVYKHIQLCAQNAFFWRFDVFCGDFRRVPLYIIIVIYTHTYFKR